MLDVICIIPSVPAKLMVGNDNVSRISTHGGGAAGNVASWLAKSGAETHIVVLKPSDTTPVSTVWMAELMQEFLPEGVINVVVGDRDTGPLS